MEPELGGYFKRNSQHAFYSEQLLEVSFINEYIHLMNITFNANNAAFA